MGWLWALLMIILGILLVRNPGEVSIAVCIFIGIALLAGGLAMIVTLLVNRGSGAEGFASSPLYGILGAVLAALGIFIWMNPVAIVSFVTILFALVIMIHAIYEITAAAVMKNMGSTSWYLSVIMSVIKFILAFMIIAQPFQIAKYIMVFAGVAMIITGVSGIVQMVRLTNTSRKFRKAADGFRSAASGRPDEIEGEILSEEDVDDDDKD
jgi:uncharacterized membrane protein HdeD (DUF308 family)